MVGTRFSRDLMADNFKDVFCNLFDNMQRSVFRTFFCQSLFSIAAVCMRFTRFDSRLLFSHCF